MCGATRALPSGIVRRRNGFCAVRDLGRMILIPLPDVGKRNPLSYSKTRMILPVTRNSNKQ